MLEQREPEGVVTFTSIYEHLEVIEACAPRGIHVMVEKPLSVYANLKQYKPAVYPDVDDDATIVLSYPGMEVVIHAIWNWPFKRKEEEQSLRVADAQTPFVDGFAFFSAAIRGDTNVVPTDLSTLETNLIVVEILDAARENHRTGKIVSLEK